MRSETISLSVHDNLVDWSGETKETIQQAQSNTLNTQQPAFDSYPQENTARFKGADNPYAAALADVFGLEA